MIKDQVLLIYAENIIVNTSCSLLHVPYTLRNETKLSDDIIKHFSFAEEKLIELGVTTFVYKDVIDRLHYSNVVKHE